MPSVKSKGYRAPPTDVQEQSTEFLRQYLESMSALTASDHPVKATHELVFRFGKPFFLTDHSFDGHRQQLHGCYRNAALLASFDDSLVYVEGYVNIGIPIEHAWCVDSDGHVVEPTLRIKGKLGLHPERITGYYGVPFRTEQLQRTLVQTGIWGMFGYHNRKMHALSPEEFEALVARSA